MEIKDFVIGAKYRNEEICQAFKCSLMSGMNRSYATNSLVLTAKHNKPLYNDEWDEDIFNYTGMGKNNDQNVNYKQNKTLNESGINNVKVYLFESFVDGEYIFSGQVKLAGEPFFVLEPGEDGELRKVIKFPLKRVENEQKILYDIEDIEKNKKIREKAVRKLTEEELCEKIKNVKPKVSVREVKVPYRDRNPYISEYTKNRANGICDLCGQKAPFIDKNNKPYLESHHIITLAEGGPDVIYNTVAICPNCHRRIHILKNKKDIEKLEKIVLKYLLEDGDGENIDKYYELFKK